MCSGGKAVKLGVELYVGRQSEDVGGDSMPSKLRDTSQREDHERI